MTEKNTCVRCGEEYKSYHVFIRDDFNEAYGYVKAQQEWNLHQGDNDGFCKPCRMAVTDYGSYLTESERQ